MRVVVVGATGNIGTSVVSALTAEPVVTSIVGVARRAPSTLPSGVEFAGADVRMDDLGRVFRNADAVVQLAWLFQPTHRPEVTWRANVIGTQRVLAAAAAEGVPAVVCASSIGAYSPARDDDPVDESWPTDGWPLAAYTREKAYVERVLDAFETEHPDTRVVRMRPSFVFQRASASEQRRLFAGPLLPHPLVRPGVVPILPIPRGLRMQALHSHDAGRAFARAAVTDARGAFNIAADPVLDRARLGELFEARTVEVPPGTVRAALSTAWRLRLAPTPPGLFDALLRLPIMDTGRARTELDWTPRFTAFETLREVLDGFRANAGGDTPPLASDAGGRFRIKEFASGVGGRDPVDAWGVPAH
ncbi:NAD-dependent epimerase/dehydratase family protein [Nocardia bhagyanarayanae]|uniref:Nucleoside-diphosphate-sugar epimerase n=1 Tax=Nocardia bhagyanarayanae TaxID=1215925 RepID=A0A543EX36_9NOCA|nr:NAD-dependent epimerase/dehydratase family protein [Nocardia bhagyanarayanae]TQM26135.1 nucleoside-diphosphate-sugar epimerase [Nocardia bhagyanarayanae]